MSVNIYYMDQFIKKVVSEGKKNHILFVKHILRGTIRPSILLPQNHKVNIIFISKETGRVRIQNPDLPITPHGF